jgi:hypothetical protein
VICLQEEIPFPTYLEYLIQSDYIAFYVITFIVGWIIFSVIMIGITNSLFPGLIFSFILTLLVVSFAHYTEYEEEKKLNDILVTLPNEKFKIVDFRITKDKPSSSFNFQGEFRKKEKETVELNWVEYGIDMNRTSAIIIERLPGDFEPYIEYKEVKIGIDSISVEEALEFEGTYNAVLSIPKSYNEK